MDKHGDKSWVLVASFLPNRTGKQIRERWHNQLDPMIMKGPPPPSLFRQLFVETLKRAFILNPRTAIGHPNTCTGCWGYCKMKY